MALKERRNLFYEEIFLIFFLLGVGGEVVCDPPGVFLKFDCVKKSGDMGLEWIGDPTNCIIARMFFDLSGTKNEEFLWELQPNEIKVARDCCNSDPFQLAFLNKVVGKF
jgi:hypothetical protein